MFIHGLDGMRYLGADPSRPADDVERIVMFLVAEEIAAEHKRAQKE